MARSQDSNTDRIGHIKTLALVALFSDDLLVDRLVLKGGNALALAYNLQDRVSADLDFSMPDMFTPEEMQGLEGRITRALESVFNSQGIVPFDILIKERPPTISEDMKDFWGGYKITFKIIEQDLYEKLRGAPDALRRQAEITSPGERKSLEIDISRHEICSPRHEFKLSGYTIYVYTLELSVFEKLRAICQQMPQYDEVVKRIRSKRTPRPRDFFDIHAIMTNRDLSVDLRGSRNLDILESVFEAKRVRLDWLLEIRNTYDQHESGWRAVQDSVQPNHELHEFRFYFEFVVDLAESLHPSRNM